MREKAKQYKERAEDSYLRQELLCYLEEEQRELMNRASSSLSSSSSSSSQTATSSQEEPLSASSLADPGLRLPGSPSPPEQLTIEDVEEDEETPEDHSQDEPSSPAAEEDQPRPREAMYISQPAKSVSSRSRYGQLRGTVRREQTHHEVHTTAMPTGAKRYHKKQSTKPPQVATQKRQKQTNNRGMAPAPRLPSVPAHVQVKAEQVGHHEEEDTPSRHHLDRTTPVKGGSLLSSIATDLHPPSTSPPPSSTLPGHRRYVPPIYPTTAASLFRSSHPHSPQTSSSGRLKPSRSTVSGSRQPALSTHITIGPSAVHTRHLQPTVPTPTYSAKPFPQHPIPVPQVPRLDIPHSDTSTPPPSHLPPPLPSFPNPPPSPPPPPPPTQHQRPVGHMHSSCATCGAVLRHTGPSLPRSMVAPQSHPVDFTQTNRLASTLHTPAYQPSRYSTTNGIHHGEGGGGGIREDDNMSVSSLSYSSCSAASEVLRRARERRDHFWTTQHAE